MKAISYSAVAGKKALIRGEIGLGKTKLLQGLLDEAAGVEGGEAITVIDMAPEARLAGSVKVGGKLNIQAPSISRYISPTRVYAPRLDGATGEEVIRLAMWNAKALEPCLMQYVQSPTPVLFVNDLTIYLQCGKTELIRATISMAKTFVGTAYSGNFFDDKGSGINAREKIRIEQLIDLFDLVVDL
ncbi:MAG: hypothetical protein H5T33_06230 [Candidatus Methanosuratus sp.]|nr:hypothetical protein [Candidatus Methanosuratincola sp.]